MARRRHHLIGVAFSHYVEKARWVLEHYGIEYTESRYLPLLHMPHAAWASRGRGRTDRVSSPFSTPILQTDRGETLCDSTEIVRYASDRWGQGMLYDDPEAAELERHYHDRLAPATRKIGYYFSLDDPEAMRALVSNVGTSQRIVFRMLDPVVSGVLKKRLNINAQSVDRAVNRVFTEIDAVDERLRDGRRYLLGDTFTAADLAFACAISPALCVQRDEGMRATFPDPATMSGRARELVERARGSHAADFALRLFAEERSRDL